MKKRILSRQSGFLIFFLLCISGFAAQEPSLQARSPGHRVIGLSPFLDQTVKDDVYRRIVGFVLEDMPVGSSLGLYDAYNLQTITQIDIPNVHAFQSGKTRANQFKEQLNKLRLFLATDHPKPTALKLNTAQAVRFPQFMEFIGENLAHTRDQPLSVAILGGPLYLDHKEPDFSMVDGYFPSDGHLLASKDQSVFGIKGRTTALNDMVVQFGYFGDPWVSEIHKEKIQRFWTLFLQGQGARLATFCGDLPTIFESFRNPGTALIAQDRIPQIDPSRSKVEMLRITRSVDVTDWITRDAVSNAAQHPPSIQVGPMKIGIRWQGNLDLDLYAAPNKESETLFFEHTRSAEGYYFKDHRSSPLREYEFIEFESPVNVWQVDARINFYQGRSPGGATGDIRIEFDGRIYTGRFSLAVSHGNEGRSGSGQAEFWTRIDVPTILRLADLQR